MHVSQAYFRMSKLVIPLQYAARNPPLAPAPGPLTHGSASVGSTPVILSNVNGMQVHILPVGAIIQRLLVPNGQGVAEDVVLGFDDPKQYQVRIWHSSPYGSCSAAAHNISRWHQISCPCLAAVAVKLNCTQDGGCNADQQYPVLWRDRGPCGESHRQRNLQPGRPHLQPGRK